MKLFKIKENVFVNCEDIEALEIVDQLKTRIYLNSGKTFVADFPYNILVDMLNKIDDGGKEVLKTLNNLSKSATHFAG